MLHSRNKRNKRNIRTGLIMLTYFPRLLSPGLLDDGYSAMAADEERERAALEWSESLIGDGGLRPKGSEIVVPDLNRDPSIGGRARGNMDPGSSPG